MTTDPLKYVTCPSVIHIIGMVETEVGLTQFSDEGKYPQPIRHHINWIYLVNTYLL